MNKLIRHKTNHADWATDIAYLTISIGCLFFILLGVRALFTPDEGRYAEIAREMVTRNDYVTPYLNNIKYFEKPALYYWLAAASIKAGGLSLWSIRSVNAILGIFGAIFTYITARILYDRTTALFSAYILPTTLLYFVMAHMISLDLPVTVFISSALYAFLLASQSKPGLKCRLLLWLCAGMCGIAVLTKGLIGVVFPAMIIGAWLLLTGEWRKLKNYYIPSCLVIFLLVALPWHIIVEQRNPEFLHFYFVEQHFLRYATKDIGHYQPAWFFIPCLIAGFFPWIVFLPQALIYKIKDPRNLFFILWAALIFIFFSFSNSKLIPYILPMFPALAILAGHYLAENYKKNVFTVSYVILLAASLGISSQFFMFLQSTSFPDKHAATIYITLASFILVAGVIITLVINGKKPYRSIWALIITTWFFLLAIHTALPAIDNRTILPLAEIVKSHIKPTDEVITYNQYYQELPFYLERRITILNWRNEMTQGMRFQDTSEWMIGNQTFWKRWHSKKRLFVIIGKDEFARLRKTNPTLTYFLLGETLNNVLISNKADQ
jgi:4-amino-4-deoxy-L-arabinose transferase-like glycosyltransferase